MLIIYDFLRKEIFAEFNFADFGSIREIWFFSFSEKKGSKWAKCLSGNCSSAKISSLKVVFLALAENRSYVETSYGYFRVLCTGIVSFFM